MKNRDQLMLIRGNHLFSHFNDGEFESMNIVPRFKETPKNEYIYFEAKYHNALYFLKEGYVKIGYFDKDGVEVIKEIIGPGDIFGQFTLLPNNMEGEFAQAFKGKVSLCVFRVEEFDRLLQKNPNISLRFARQLGQKLVRIENRMINLLHKSVPERLIYFFICLSKQFPHYLHDNQFSMPNIFTHDDIAKMIGSSRQTITTFINQWEASGLLRFSRTRFDLWDVNELQNKMDVRKMNV